MHATSLILGVGSVWIDTLGRFHMVVVHFPIALLILAGSAELAQMCRRRPGHSALAEPCLIVGTLTGAVAVLLGFFHKWTTHFGGDAAAILAWHQWLGLSAVAAGLIAMLALPLCRRGSATGLAIFRLATLAAALLVGFTGHYGGELTYGQGYLTELLFPQPQSPAPSVPPTTGPATAPATQSSGSVHFPADGKIVFARDVQPILRTCLDCHGPEKHKGALRLDSRTAILKGGDSGPAIVPGDGQGSVLIHRVLGLGDDKRMPPKGPPLSDEKIRILRAWIDQGAVW